MEPTPANPTKPEPTSSKQTLTFKVPHILKSFTVTDGFTHRDVREGGDRQIEFETSMEWSETPVDERDQVFAIRATNQLNFAGSVIQVINDAIDEPSIGFRLVPTDPTASEYLSKVGKRVMVAFNCTKDPVQSNLLGVDIYKIARIFIPLP